VDETSDMKAISVVTVQEYLCGIYFHYSGSKLLNQKMRKAIADLSYFEQLPYTREVARIGARIDAEMLKSGKPIPFADVVIAATALHHDLPLVTRDIHFRDIPGLTVIRY